MTNSNILDTLSLFLHVVHIFQPYSLYEFKNLTSTLPISPGSWILVDMWINYIVTSYNCLFAPLKIDFLGGKRSSLSIDYVIDP